MMKILSHIDVSGLPCDYIAIPRTTLERLHEDSCMLRALEAGGVDNWEWYGEIDHDGVTKQHNVFVRKLNVAQGLPENDGFDDE